MTNSFSLRRRLLPLTILSLYPLLSSLGMLCVWQMLQYYATPFFGVYYFSWCALYRVYTPDLWSVGVEFSQLIFGILSAALTLMILSALHTLFAKRGKIAASCLMLLFWLADCAFLVFAYRENFSDLPWQFFVQIGEHLLFAVIFAFFIVRGLVLFVRERTLWAYEKKKTKKKLKEKTPEYQAVFGGKAVGRLQASGEEKSE